MCASSVLTLFPRYVLKASTRDRITTDKVVYYDPFWDLKALMRTVELASLRLHGSRKDKSL